MTGAEHYREAQRLLGEAAANEVGETFRADVHATLALAAATALSTTHKFVGDSAEVTDWARAIQPTALAHPAKAVDDQRPEFWPPQPGQIWQDRNKDRWICTATPSTTPYLVCVARQGDDSAEEIWDLYGPMTFIQSMDPTEVECPF